MVLRVTALLPLAAKTIGNNLENPWVNIGVFVPAVSRQFLTCPSRNIPEIQRSILIKISHQQFGANNQHSAGSFILKSFKQFIKVVLSFTS